MPPPRSPLESTPSYRTGIYGFRRATGRKVAHRLADNVVADAGFIGNGAASPRNRDVNLIWAEFDGPAIHNEMAGEIREKYADPT